MQNSQPNQGARQPRRRRQAKQSDLLSGILGRPNDAREQKFTARSNSEGAAQPHPGEKKHPKPPHKGQQPTNRPAHGGQKRHGAGKKPRGAGRPTMAGLIQSVHKADSSKIVSHKAGVPSDSESMNRLDSRDSGMLYPGSQFHEKPRTFRDAQAKLRIIPLGGLEEIGMNCTAIEYGDDIIVIDIGWMFPDETMPGIDYVIPDVSYLEKKKQNIRGVVITHGHLDHIGGAPYLLPKLGFPPVYATQLAAEITKSNIQEYGIADRVRFNLVKYSDKLQLGVFGIEFFHVNHNIPEGMGIAVTTPHGLIVHSGDFKFDETPVADEPAEFDKIKALGERGVLLAMCDSTNVERPGHTASEREIGQNLREQIGNARGRVIMATFSTLIARLQEALTAAAENGRKVTVVGRSMLRNIEICQRLDYLDIPKDILVDSRNLKRYADHELLILCTGSQADEMSALARMSRGEHKQVQIKSGDTVILSSSPIAGNERAIESMMDDLFRQGADVIYSKLFDIHTSGHAYQDELKQMLQMLKPKHFMPIHGEYRKRVLHGRLANSLGLAAHNVHLPDNGMVVEVNHKGDVALTKEKVGGNPVLVDGLGVGDVGQIVLRDRKHMAEDGMLVCIILVDRRTGKLVGSPDIISRGFIYLRESGDLLNQARAEVKKIMARPTKGGSEENYLKNKLRDELGDFLYEKTQRRPMVLPVLIKV